mgnify:CR=1 FL=1
MNREEINEKKQVGDFRTAANMLGLTYANTRILWQRPNAKRYPQLEAAMAKIIKSREELLEEVTNQHCETQK